MSLRDAMPETAAFIDFVREVAGAGHVNAEIRKGMAGIPGHFHASERGHETGTPFADRGGWVSLADIDVTPLPAAGKRGRQ